MQGTEVWAWAHMCTTMKTQHRQKQKQNNQQQQ